MVRESAWLHDSTRLAANLAESSVHRSGAGQRELFLRAALHAKSGGTEHCSAIHAECRWADGCDASRLSPKKYARTTTAAHELAASIIFTSGIIHYADKPEFFESLPPQALQIFRDAPARWDETKCLVGEPGQVAVFARRSGKSWFIAGINGTGDAMPVNLNLSAFKKCQHRFAVVEGDNANMQVAVKPLKTSNEWQHEMPPRGGFILRLDE